MNTAEVLETPQEKVILRHDDQAEFQIKESVKTFIPLITELREAWNEMGLGPATLEELGRHYHESEQWVRELVYENTPALKSLPIEKSFALKMVNLPNGFSRFVSVMTELGRQRSTNRYAELLTNDLYWNQDKEGNYSTSKAFDSYLDKSCNVYASPKQVETIKVANEAIELLKELQRISGKAQIFPHGFGLIVCDASKGGRLSLNKEMVQFIK